MLKFLHSIWLLYVLHCLWPALLWVCYSYSATLEQHLVYGTWHAHALTESPYG